MNDKNNAEEIDNDIILFFTLTSMKAIGKREQTFDSFTPLKQSRKASESKKGSS